jgi:hypothetical protein
MTIKCYYFYIALFLYYHNINGLGQRSLCGYQLGGSCILAPVGKRRTGRLVLAGPVDGPITIEDECAIGTP